MDRPNIIVAVFDSLPLRYLTQWSGTIDFLPADSDPFVVKHCYATATITTPSVTTMFTGLYPKRHKVISHWERKLFRLDPEIPTLAQILKVNGYQTLLAVNTYLGLELYNGVGISRGFEARYEILSSHKTPQAFTDAIDLSRARIQREPFFLFIHYFNTHLPYGRQKFFAFGGRLRFKWRDPEFSMEQACVQRIKDTAANVMKPTLDFALEHDAILFVLSDHGETFISRNVGGHAHWVNEDTARVVWLMANGPRGINADLHSLVDLMPTILGLAEIEAPQCDGVDIFKGAHDTVYCMNEPYAPTWPKVFATITKDNFVCDSGNIPMPVGVGISDAEKVSMRLKALGYID